MFSVVRDGALETNRLTLHIRLLAPLNQNRWKYDLNFIVEGSLYSLNILTS